jgi:hypothetical protein
MAVLRTVICRSGIKQAITYGERLVIEEWQVVESIWDQVRRPKRGSEFLPFWREDLDFGY